MDANNPKKLYRSKENQVIGGVAGGLAEYFNVDSLVMRIILIVVALISQIIPAVIAYLIAMIVIPKEGEEKDVQSRISDTANELGEKLKSTSEAVKKSSEKHRVRNIFGFLLIFVGIIMLINHLFPWYKIGFVYIWPLLIIIAGLYLILKKK